MSVWEDIKARLSVVDVISDYVDVRQVGATYKCVCPFHNDKNPSLIISPEKGLWHCFGCGAGGDMFRFVTDFENISKRQALEKLAKKAGVELEKIQKPKTTAEEISHRERGLQYLSWAADVYHKALRKVLTGDNPTSQYVHSRHLNQETINTFALGYAPTSNFLYNIAQKYQLDAKLLEAVGLLRTTDRGEIKDKFSDRLMIPIRDQFGNVVGFTGRIIREMEGVERPKYLNTPQTDWFHKSQVWFGLDIHQKPVRKARKAVILEGNMDVIASHKAGLEIGLASQGTSVTEDHLRRLKQFTQHIVVAFDNDAAGVAAERKLAAQALAFGYEVDKLIIPDIYKDLDEWIQGASLNLAEYNLDQHQRPYLDYLIQKNRVDLTTQDIRIQHEVLVRVLEVLKYADSFGQEHYLTILSELTKKRVKTLQSEMRQTRDVVTAAQNSHEPTTSAHYKDSLQAHMYVAWQNIIVGTAGEQRWNLELLSEEDKKGITALYALLKTTLSELGEYASAQEYLQKNQPELELIKDNMKTSIDLNLLKSQLKQYLANIYSNFATHPELLAHYQSALTFLQ
jgi:DNA primase